MFDTIVALATAPLKSALAIIRFSGDNCFDVVSNFFSKDLNKYTKNSILHGKVLDNNEVVDDVVLLLYINPHSFTGENSVEIISHGSMLIANKIIELALKNGARMADRGEYTLRAYLHKKMDLIQAESVNDLINAESEESKKLSLLSLSGKTSSLIDPIKKDLTDLLSNIEVNIDYPEYVDIEVANNEDIVQVCNKNITYIDSLIKNGKKGNIIKDGINVAIVGKPNVGKSSILNNLIGEDKAIVTDIKGTTRDVVEGKYIYKGISVNLFDTAGIHESKDLIEGIGIKKSIDKINQADLILYVLDSFSIDKEDQEIFDLIKHKKFLTIYNKSDLVSKYDVDKIYFNNKTDENSKLKDLIYNTLELTNENYINPSINNAREIGILENIENELKEILEHAKNLPIDMVASKLKDCLLKVLSITGEDCDFDMTKEIFSRFCVGK